MNNEIIKNTIKVGNSAGVLLPKQWLNFQVKILLQPLNTEKDIINLLINENFLKDTLGAYIVGSYAREEQTIESDVDVLIITNNINKRIEKGKYDLTIISKQELEKQLKNNSLPILPMLREAKPIINESLIIPYKNQKLTKKNIKWHIDTTKSAMRVIKKSIELSKEMETKEGDATAYSLILRLRTLYIIKSIQKNKKPTKKEFLKLIKKIAGSLIAYEEYLRVKSKDKKRYEYLPIEEAEKLMNYINKEIPKFPAF